VTPVSVNTATKPPRHFADFAGKGKAKRAPLRIQIQELDSCRIQFLTFLSIVSR
jgi:hypothetical protein